MTDCPYKVGDIIEHRLSKRRAYVFDIELYGDDWFISYSWDFSRGCRELSNYLEKIVVKVGREMDRPAERSLLDYVHEAAKSTGCSTDQANVIADRTVQLLLRAGTPKPQVDDA